VARPLACWYALVVSVALLKIVSSSSLALLSWFIVAVMFRQSQRRAGVAVGGALAFTACSACCSALRCRRPLAPLSLLPTADGSRIFRRRTNGDHGWISSAAGAGLFGRTQPANLLWCFAGVLGTVMACCRLEPPATTRCCCARLLHPPANAMIMLAGIYYGAKYGGRRRRSCSTRRVGLGGNLPDSYQMARKGRAGAALGIAAIASFVAGTVGVLGLMLVAPPLARLSLAFSSPEYFALMTFGLAMVVLLAGSSLVKALLSMLVGLWIAGIGTDLFSATSRFTFGRMELGGIDFVIVAIGIFAIAEVRQHGPRDGARMLPVPRDCATCCRRARPRDCRFAFLNGSVLGFLIGVLPGAGSTIASFLSYGSRSRFAASSSSAPASSRALRHRKAPTIPRPAARWCRC
jgi:hypothetical protein